MQQIIRDKPDGMGTFASEFHVFCFNVISIPMIWNETSSYKLECHLSNGEKNVCEIDCIHYGVKFVNEVNVLIRKLVYHLNYSRHINAS